MAYYANYYRECARLKPTDTGHAIGVIDELGCVLGWATNASWPNAIEDVMPEARWRLWIGKDRIDGEWWLRSGEFVPVGQGGRCAKRGLDG